MGQKVNPIGFRIGIFSNHLSQWFSPFSNGQYFKTVLEDHLCRQYLIKALKGEADTKQRRTSSVESKKDDLKALRKVEAPAPAPSGAVALSDALPMQSNKTPSGVGAASRSLGGPSNRGDAGLSKILISRFGERISLEIHVVQPKVVLGEGGLRLKELTENLSNLITLERSLRSRAPCCEASLAVNDGGRVPQGSTLLTADAHDFAEPSVMGGGKGKTIQQRGDGPRSKGQAMQVEEGDQAGFTAIERPSDDRNPQSGSASDRFVALRPVSLSLHIIQIADPRIDANIVAQRIAQQLEKRASYRRVLKQAIKDASEAGVAGIKIEISGRLNGAEIARSETIKHGNMPLHTLRASIDYCSHFAETVYGKLGIKVWIHTKKS